MIAAAVLVQRARLARALLPILGPVVLLPVIVIGAAGGTLISGGGPLAADTRTAWGDDVPPEMAALYEEAAERFAVPVGLLKAVGKIETDHCRNPLAMTPNSAGAVGCMQFLPSTFTRWAGASGSSAPSILDPRDSVFAAAAKLSADGIAGDPWQALWAYNHSDAYVADVLAWAVAYGWRGGTRGLLGRALLAHPDVAVRAGDAIDVRNELVDVRLLSALLALATRHDVASVGPFTRHSYFVAGTNSPSNHVFGRAVDIPIVGGQAVSGGNGAARQLVVDTLTLPDDIRPNEVLSPWDLRIGEAWSLADDDHGDHLHLGYDGGATA